METRSLRELVRDGIDLFDLYSLAVNQWDRWYIHGYWCGYYEQQKIPPKGYGGYEELDLKHNIWHQGYEDGEGDRHPF